jgi:large subunit ribosomal protein L4
LRNVESVHVIAPDQLNTYDVLVSDDVVFTRGALTAFVDGRKAAGDATESVTVTESEAKPAKKAAAKKAPAKKTAAKKAAAAGATKPAGDGVSDDEAVAEVAEQTSSDLKAEDVFEREAEGTSAETPVAEATADEVAE